MNEHQMELMMEVLWAIEQRLKDLQKLLEVRL
jgi:hypothetical protein